MTTHPRRSTRVLPRVEPATLRAARDAAGHSQSQAAATLGIPIKRLQAWEHGEGAMDEGWLQLYLLLTGQTTVARARQALTAAWVATSPRIRPPADAAIRPENPPGSR